jgi:Fe2+ or Zn2+ uptake regulation protein
MTITAVFNNSGVYEIACDECSYVEEVEASSKADAAMIAREALGFHTSNKMGDWYDVCPDCQDTVETDADQEIAGVI